MRIRKDDIPVRLSTPGATARQELNFGDATNYGTLAGEYFSLAAGTDLTPLLKGLENDLCQSPHWGYLLKGRVHIGYGNGDQETLDAGDLFYLPPDHTVQVEQDAEIILFSPQNEHCAVVEHLQQQLVEA